MASAFPQQAGAISIEPAHGGHAHLSVAGLAVQATFVPFAQTALPTPDHAVHVAVFAEAAVQTRDERRVVARAVTLVAASLAMRRDCVGVIWDDLAQCLPPERYRRAVTRLDAGQDPFALWIDIQDEPESAQEPRGAQSAGLAAFFDCEVALEPVEATPDERRRILGAVLAQIFQDRATIPNGATFRIENAGDFIAAALPPDPVLGVPICLVRRLPSPEDATEAVAGGRGSHRRSSAIVLFDPAAQPDPDEITRAVERHTKKLGLVPDMQKSAADRLVADWGVVRGGGARKSEIVYRDWRLPEALISFVLAESGDVIRRHPDLLEGTLPVLIREIPSITPSEPSILGATLLTSLSGALLTLPGARAVLWPSSGIVMTKSEAEEHFRRSGAGLPIALCVARLSLELEGGRQVFVTRGLAELGERNILMMMDDPTDHTMRDVFDSLVRASFDRTLVRRGDVFVNDRDGAQFEVEEVTIDGIGQVLKARLIAPPKPLGGLTRFLRKR
ncbi:MAG: hypothetical protein AAGC92_03125 [Pseudomonadota bacterium]